MAVIYIPLEGVLHGRKPAAPKGYYWRPWKGILILAKTPHTGKYKRSDLQNAWVANFKEIACYTKWVDPKTFDKATELAKGTNWYYRDVIERALSNKLIRREGETRVTTPTVRVHETVAEALVAGTTKFLTPTVKDWDNNFFWNPTVNPTRLTCRSPGLYLIGGEIQYNVLTGGYRSIRLRKNGGAVYSSQTVTVASAVGTTLQLFTVDYLHANDYIELGALTATAAVTALLANFWVVAITPEAII